MGGPARHARPDKRPTTEPTAPERSRGVAGADGGSHPHATDEIGGDLITSIRRGEVDAVLGTGPMAGEVLVVNTLHAEEQQRGLIDDLRKEKQKLEEFAFATAHDLRGPLSNIDSEIAGLLAQHARLRLPLWFVDSLRQIELAAVRMRLLVSDLMLLGEIGSEAEPLESIALLDVVAGVLDGLRPALTRTHVAVEIVDELPVVRGRLRQLEAIFENLIDNALRYAGASSKGKVMIGCSRSEAEMVVWIRDNGAGFDPRESAAVFEPYVRLDKSGDNTGLGLTIVRNAVSAHGGRTWIETAPGSGATAFVALPAARLSAGH
jgi:signal transduction histidine kinase